MELTHLPPKAAAVLLARLALGYEYEAVRGGESALRAVENAPEDLAMTLSSILTYRDTFRGNARDGQDIRVSRLFEPKTRTAFELVEHAGGTVLLSGMAR